MRKIKISLKIINKTIQTFLIFNNFKILIIIKNWIFDNYQNMKLSKLRFLIIIKKWIFEK